MSDQGMRSAEREAIAGATELDLEVMRLRHQLRSGKLTRGKLHLAGYCGHQAALLALGEDEPVGRTRAGEDIRPTADLDSWCRGLWRWGYKVMVRAAVSAAEEVRRAGFDRGQWDRRRSFYDYDTALVATKAARAWLDCGEAKGWSGLHPPDNEPLDWWYYLRLLLWDLRSGATEAPGLPWLLIVNSGRQAGAGDVQRAACEELAPWALA